VPATASETGFWYAGDGMNPGSTYYWRVRQSTPMTGPWSAIRSFTVGAPGQQQLVLKKGWNLVSLAVNPGTKTPAQIFNVTGGATIFGWDATLGRYVQPSSVEAGRGYWVGVNQDANLTIVGQPWGQ
jgi:hypothetical protein